MSSFTNASIRYAFAAVFATSLVAGVGSAVYSRHTQERGEQQWCSVLGALVARYQDPGWVPPDQGAAELATYITALYNDFRCADVDQLKRP